CVNCHGLVTSFDDFIAKVDYDRDGLIEPVQHEIEGVLHEVGMLLPPEGEPGVEVTSDYTPLQLSAAYNYFSVEEDGSHGIQNFQFSIDLLRVTHAALATGDIGAGTIQEIADVPNDQGKQVRVVWSRFGGDGVGPMPIKFYSKWRRVDGGHANALGKTTAAVQPFESVVDNLTELAIGTRVMMEEGLWDFAGTVPASGQDYYSALAPTLYDSTISDGMHWSVFVVKGHTDNPALHAVSAPDSGYSLDNLAPAVPANLNALETASGVVVAWDEAVDEDVKYFALFRGTASGFDPAQPITTTTDPTFTDVDVTIGMTYYYRVSSTDFAGNKSELSSEFALLVTSVEGVELAAVPDDYVLLQNYPNPFNPSTEIAFGLPKEDHVTLVVYNVLGARVRTLAEGTFAAGHHSLVWQGDNDRGQNVGPGMYFYRLETSSTTLTMKMILLK
ncbi:MAG: T9SS type A sorting domain-containing protein, partial [bacterium]